MIEGSPTLDANSARTRVNLNGRQLALHRALGEIQSNLATSYEGALAVLDTSNPDRLSLAAHAIREIMDKLPRFMDLPVKASPTDLGTEANNLRDEWARLCNNTGCLQDGKWMGEIDAPMSRFMRKVDDFFVWKDEHRPRWTDQAARVLHALDPIRLPDQLVKQNASLYLEIRGFFVAVAHHRGCLEEEFVKWMDAFEVFLLERLVPRTYDDFDAIDRLIVGGSSADS